MDYVNILFDMVLRNLAEGYEGRFVCFTDDHDLSRYSEGVDICALPHPGLHGWFHKLSLFKPGVFEEGERVVFLDLDTLIVGRLDEFFAYDGDFAILQDLGGKENRFASGIMAWRGGFGREIWDCYAEAGFPVDGGDDQWIQRSCVKADFIQDLFPDLVVSYKFTGCAIPRCSSIVCFHGHPRPHEVTEGWVPQVWKVGGISRVELDVICNVETDERLGNIRSACARDLPWFDIKPAHDGVVVICGGGRSLKSSLGVLKQAKAVGSKIWALNGAGKYLEAHDVIPDAVVVLDARPENAEFVRLGHMRTEFFIGSQAHPGVFDAVPEWSKVTLFHSNSAGAPELLKELEVDKPTHLLGGGSTVGLQAIVLAHLSGFRTIHLFGMDSCYLEGEHHAYLQSLNDGEVVLDVEVGDRRFKCAPWMATQAQEFAPLIAHLVEDGLTLTVAGNGLLAAMAREMMRVELVGDRFRKIDGWLIPKHGDPAVVNQIMWTAQVYVDMIARLSKQRRLAVQAGGNVGIIPQMLSQRFDHVSTFEPEAENFAALLENAKDVEAYNGALGEDHKRVGLEHCGDAFGCHKINGGGDVPMVTLDSMFFGRDVDAICLDVEGYESRVIDGARQTIQRCKPVIAIEENGLSERYGVKEGDLTARICAEFGYEVAASIGRDVILKPSI